MTAIVLAAGEGKRMGSSRAKVLHELCGRPLVTFPLAAAVEAGARRLCVVTGFDEASVRATVLAWAAAAGHDVEVSFAHQPERWGTGHAVECALPEVPERGPVWILSGDVPLVRPSTLRALRTACTASTAGFALASFEPGDPHGYGRVLRDATGAVLGIREERDASAEERAITECNAGAYCIEAHLLHEGIPTLQRKNAQGEKYLTDLVSWAAARGHVLAERIDALEAEGVNTPEQLRELEEAARRRGDLDLSR